jgi:Protein of unknown function (DUF3592)
MNTNAILCIPIAYGAGIWCGIKAFRNWRRFSEAKYWPSVQGTILESVIIPDVENKRTHFRVRYEFALGDRIESCTPRLSGDWFLNNRLQEEFVARYSSGQTVEVFYDPRDPKLNCIDKTDKSGIHVLGWISLAGFVGGSVLLYLVMT